MTIRPGEYPGHFLFALPHGQPTVESVWFPILSNVLLRCQRDTLIQWWPRLFVENTNTRTMDNLTPVRSFLKELITPIVKDAVKTAMTVQSSSATKHYIPIAEAVKLYGMSVSTIYNRFDDGTLTKIKNGGLTFVIQEEIEASMQAEKLSAVDENARGRKGRK